MNGRNLLVWGLVIVFVVVALQLFEFNTPGPEPTELKYSDFIERVESGSISSATVAKGEVTGELSDGGSNKRKRTRPASSSSTRLMRLAGIAAPGSAAAMTNANRR